MRVSKYAYMRKEMIQIESFQHRKEWDLDSLKRFMVDGNLS